MRLLRALPPTLLSSLAILLASSPIPTTAKPLPQNDLLERAQDDIPTSNHTLFPRCDGTPCGWYGQLCCQSGESCVTDSNNQAQCQAGGGGAGAAAVTQQSGGSWVTYTSTWVETNAVTKTSIWSSYMGGAATATAASITCNYAMNESPCGSICCSSGQYCMLAGKCAQANGGQTTAGIAPSAPLRPTTLSNGVVVTATVSPTTTLPFQTPIATGAAGVNATAAQAGGGLSGGAIAGIVIGVLLGLLLLILLCLCCCAKGLLDTILAIFGKGKKKKQGRRVEEEVYVSHHSSGRPSRYGAAVGAASADGRTWYGSNRPSRPERPPPKKKGPGGLAAVTAGLGALGLGLFAKRKIDKKRKDEKSDISSSYYSYGTYTSTSSSSTSDRHTRRSSRR